MGADHPLGPTVLMMTVLMNRDCPIMLEAIKYHQEQNPDVFADEVAEIVRSTYGEVAVCKIAHSQKLTKYVNEQDLDERYGIAPTRRSRFLSWGCLRKKA
jgi:hypothetical protein